ncbi:CAP domain-containing protein [Ectobacillus ponti]|uniref:CAP domain-containing protein n=1 Tax=Ectobacillus ponti TaxID=2961894 RepID=A0AA41X789_9BACI|nr:CAP domain-containing protein [Ectobacillus ponti]MCP8968478.1 CAP domain-containing protein [Ectobacillus ponti]
MIRLRTLTTIAALSLSLTAMTGCGDNERRNASAPNNLSANDTLRNTSNRLTDRDRTGMTNRTNTYTNVTDRTNLTDRTGTNMSNSGNTSLNNAVPARNARGYVTPNAVSYNPAGSYGYQQTATVPGGGYVRLCPCPNQQTPSTGTAPRTGTTPSTGTAPNTGSITPKATTPAPSAPSSVTGGSVSTAEARVIDLTNAERRKAGLAALTSDAALSKVAQAKSNDMRANNYFDHQSPTYGSPFDMMRTFGVSYSYAGENIAKGQRTPEEVVQAWMNSPGHRANILNSNYTRIGVGYESTQNIWSQEFTRP